MADLLARLRHRPQTAQSAILAHLDHVLAAFPAQGATREAVAPLAASPTSFVEPLTKRESRVLALLATDSSPYEIVRQLGISSTTIRTHVRNIYPKLGAHSRYEAVQRARELRMI